jgi:ParB/RepB/Spo0J family partition protein
MNALTPLAVTNADVLRALGTDPTPATINALAREIDRDESNLRKSVKRLQTEGLLTSGGDGVPGLTEAGRAALAAIERAESPSASTAGFVEVYHAQLAPDPGNARSDWDSAEADEALDALAASIKEDGLLNLLLIGPPLANGVRVHFAGEDLPMHKLIGGERRWRAIGMLIQDGSWPADRKIPCLLRDKDGLAREYIALADNLQRRNLNPLEEAKAFARLEKQGEDTADIARRTGVTQRQVQMRLQLLKLSEADQERMLLPKDDPEYLSPTGARDLLQEKREKPATETQSSVPAPSQPSRIDLTPRQIMILGEMAAAGDARGKDKHGALELEIRTFPNAWADKELGQLIALGFIGFSSQYPAKGLITLAGRSWWAGWRPLGAPDKKLKSARQEALGSVEFAALKDGEFATSWLNMPRPPEPPKPLSPTELVIALELLAKAKSGYADVPHDWPQDTLSARLKNCLRVEAPSVWSQGQTRVYVYYYQLGLPNDPAERDKALDKARKALDPKRAAALQSGEWMTPWLNGGPWSVSPEIQAELDAAQRTREAVARQRQADATAAAEQRNALQATAERAANGPVTDIRSTFQRLLAKYPLPWRYDVESGDVYDAEGEEVPLNRWDDHQGVTWLSVIAINSAAGLPTAYEPPEPAQDEPETEDEEA